MAGSLTAGAAGKSAPAHLYLTGGSVQSNLYSEGGDTLCGPVI